MIVRPARHDDAESLTDIHNAAVLRSTALWTDELVTTGNRAAFLAEQQAGGYAVLVAELDGTVLGYASFGSWRAKNGYRLTVGDSVYVREGHHGAGIGHALLAALIERARAGGFHVMIADIEAGNAASIRLHERLGFEVCGTIREAGTKFGRWLDLTIMRLELTAGPPPAASPAG